MGDYIYNVRRTPAIITTAGEHIHATTFAYKPYGRAKEDDRLRRLAGCTRAERAWAEQRGPVLIVHTVRGKLEEGSPVVQLDGCCGTVWDGVYDAKPVGHIHKQKGRWVLVREGDAQ